MHVSFNLAATFDAALKTAAASAGFAAADFAPEVRTADPKHGDFQANGVLPYAKRTKQNPRALAEKLVAALPADVAGACVVTVAGPGFINFTLQPAALQDWLRAFSTRAQLSAGAAAGGPGRTWVVDYSSPNTAKQMHVGHLRSAVIGESISRLLAFSGARVIRDNHIGDWGTQFGKLIWAYKKALAATPAELEAALASDPLAEFERLYKTG
ncbi:MAG TPA: arginine--tRNA ligase, partial [Rariglobus sp.]